MGDLSELCVAPEEGTPCRQILVPPGEHNIQAKITWREDKTGVKITLEGGQIWGQNHIGGQ